MGRCSGSALLIEMNTAGSAETPGRELVDDHEPRFQLRPAPATRGGTGGYRDYWLVERPFSREEDSSTRPDVTDRIQTASVKGALRSRSALLLRMTERSTNPFGPASVAGASPMREKRQCRIQPGTGTRGSGRFARRGASRAAGAVTR